MDFLCMNGAQRRRILRKQAALVNRTTGMALTAAEEPGEASAEP
jgi:hypothetical protein